MPARLPAIWVRAAFDDAVCEFAVEYADQNQRDHRAFIKAVREGRLEAITEPV
jgi:RPA family protein